jgi:hypothetical protein
LKVEDINEMNLKIMGQKSFIEKVQNSMAGKIDKELLKATALQMRVLE